MFWRPFAPARARLFWQLAGFLQVWPIPELKVGASESLSGDLFTLLFNPLLSW